MWVVEESVEQQWPGIEDAVAPPGLLCKSRITCQLRAHPLILDCKLKQKFGHQKKEDPLKAEQADIAPDLKLVFAIESPTFERLNAKHGHKHGVEHCVPERP